MMKKSIILLLLAILFSASAHAGMEQTDKCNERIGKLKRNIENWESEKQNLKKFIDNPPPLIFPPILDSKRRTISELEDKIGEAQEELEKERGRLKNYKRVFVTKIYIKAYGSWDSKSSPDIYVKRGDTKIAVGNDNTREVDFSLYEDVTFYDSLYVYDYDPNDPDDDMGRIPLKKEKIKPGVAGDTDVIKLYGNVKTPDGAIDYAVWLEVEY